MIREIEVCVKGDMFLFLGSDYSQNHLELMWEMLNQAMADNHKVLSLSPDKDILIRPSSIDYAHKVIVKEDE